jgi:hypothetical protein
MLGMESGIKYAINTTYLCICQRNTNKTKPGRKYPCDTVFRNRSKKKHNSNKGWMHEVVVSQTLILILRSVVKSTSHLRMTFIDDTDWRYILYISWVSHTYPPSNGLWMKT